MNILMCYDYVLVNCLFDRLLDNLVERHPDLVVERNFEQVRAMAAAGEVERLIVCIAGFNWIGATDEANLIFAEDVARLIHDVNKNIKVMALTSKENLPEWVVKVPEGGDEYNDERFTKISEFLTA